MVQVKARFDGEKVILPSGFKAVGVGEVTVTFPDEMVNPAAERARTLNEILKDVRPTGRTVEDVNRQVRETRDEWDDDPRERLKGKA